MKKIILLTQAIFFIGIANTIAQGTFNINPYTKQITNWETRYDFNSAYSYDFDLKQATSEVYPSECIVVINISSDGSGRLVTSMGGQKGVWTIVTAYAYDTYYLFNILNPNGRQTTAKMNISNNKIDKFWIVNDGNVGIVFTNYNYAPVQPYSPNITYDNSHSSPSNYLECADYKWMVGTNFWGIFLAKYFSNSKYALEIGWNQKSNDNTNDSYQNYSSYGYSFDFQRTYYTVSFKKIFRASDRFMHYYFAPSLKYITNYCFVDSMFHNYTYVYDSIMTRTTRINQLFPNFRFGVECVLVRWLVVNADIGIGYLTNYNESLTSYSNGLFPYGLGFSQSPTGNTNGGGSVRLDGNIIIGFRF